MLKRDSVIQLKSRRSGLAGRGEIIWGLKIRLAAPRNPLKTLKTAEEMFGKALRFQAKSLDRFGKSLEKAWRGPKLARDTR